MRSEVLLETVPDVLSIPLEAVFTSEDGDHSVRVQDGQGWRPQGIDIGASNDTHVVVTSGLLEGQTVALIDPDTLNDAAKPGEGKGGPGAAAAGQP